VEEGYTSNQGLIAQGRAQCFDYLLGERDERLRGGGHAGGVPALLLLAERPVLSVNGECGGSGSRKRMVAFGRFPGRSSGGKSVSPQRRNGENDC